MELAPALVKQIPCEHYMYIHTYMHACTLYVCVYVICDVIAMYFSL